MKDKNIGKFISELRLHSGYKTLKQLSQVSGVSSATISRIEANIQKPLPGTLWRLFPYFKDITYQELLKRCGYEIEADQYPKELYSHEELRFIEKLRDYEELYQDVILKPDILEQLYSIWKLLKQEVLSL
jgi:transcriptional regulator with XRE-family HTH domain